MRDIRDIIANKIVYLEKEQKKPGQTIRSLAYIDGKLAAYKDMLYIIDSRKVDRSDG